VEVLPGEVGDDRVQALVVPAQVVAERADAELVAAELGLELEPPAGAPVEAVVLGGEVEEPSSGQGQNFIFEIVS
jgi:hypothetical protein